MRNNAPNSSPGSILPFVEAIDEENRTRYEKEYWEEAVRVKVVTYFICIGKG